MKGKSLFPFSLSFFQPDAWDMGVIAGALAAILAYKDKKIRACAGVPGSLTVPGVALTRIFLTSFICKKNKPPYCLSQYGRLFVLITSLYLYSLPCNLCNSLSDSRLSHVT